MLTEADTCDRFITPALLGAGWDLHGQIRRERAFTDGRVAPRGLKGKRKKRKKRKRVDYLLS